MAASKEGDLCNLAQYLCVSCGKLTVSDVDKVIQLKSGDVSLQGLATIAKYLVQQSCHKHLLGQTAAEKAQVNQWLEYRLTHVDRCASITDIYQLLKELNSHLQERAYLVGWQLTLADIMLYYGLHCVMSKIEHVDRQKYLNVSRWFDHIQHLPGVQQNLPPVIFIRNTVYTSFGH